MCLSEFDCIVYRGIDGGNGKYQIFNLCLTFNLAIYLPDCRGRLENKDEIVIT